jgi:phosphoribosylformylglycinamidine synthase subunit PurSL
LMFGAPFISGKDSLNNEYMGADGQRHAIPPTLLISALGMMDDVSKAVTMDLKNPGNEIYLVGQFEPVFGGSHFGLVRGEVNEAIPDVHEITPKVYKALHDAVGEGLIRSAHDISEGGLAVSAAEMCIGGRLGIEVIDKLSIRDLFGETTGCLLLEIGPENISRFEETFKGFPFRKLGTVTSAQVLKFGNTSIEVEELIQAFNIPI